VGLRLTLITCEKKNQVPIIIKINEPGGWVERGLRLISTRPRGKLRSRNGRI
jgi:hypothetical protein